MRKPADDTSNLRHLLLAVIAFVLIAALAFLYDKTQAVDLRERNEIAALLRQLREIDGRWDIDVMRERIEFNANQLAAPNRTAAAKKALAALQAAAPRADSAAVSEGLTGLTKAVLEKADLVEKFKRESASTKEALHAVLSGGAALRAQTGEPRKTDARQKAFEQTIDQLIAAVEQYYW
ncbi:MAG: DAHL domain-containing protein, partial [Pseudomonadota bacterium]